MGTGTLIALGGGTLSAAMSTAALSGSLAGAALAYFTPLPLLMTGLGLGLASVVMAGVAGVIIVGVFGGAVAALLYGGMHAVPAWLVVRHVLLQQPAAVQGAGERLGAILGLLAALAGAAVALTLLFGAGSDGAEATVLGFLNETLTVAMPHLGEDDRTTLVATIVPFFVGGCGATWEIMIVVNAALAQSLLSSRGRNLRPSPRWSAIQLPEWVAWPLVAAAVVALVAPGDLQFVARNLVLVFAVPYFILGLAVVHTLARRTAAKGMFLAAFYIMLALFFLGAAVAVAGLGVIEHWFGVRRRLKGNNIDQETT